MKTLLLLTDSKVDLASAVKRTVVEECEQFLKILNELRIFLLFLADRSNEFVVVLNFYHERCQFQIEQEDIFLVLNSS